MGLASDSVNAMKLPEIYAAYLRDAVTLIVRLGVRQELVQNDTLCLQVPSNDRYDAVKEELARWGHMISESEVNGRLIAVYELDEPLSASGWQATFVEVPQPKTGTELEGVRHLQFVTRTGIESFRTRFPELDFKDRGNVGNRLLEIDGGDTVVRFHDKNMGSVIELERGLGAHAS